jgi:hypothetical protein
MLFLAFPAISPVFLSFQQVSRIFAEPPFSPHFPVENGVNSALA